MIGKEEHTIHLWVKEMELEDAILDGSAFIAEGNDYTQLAYKDYLTYLSSSGQSDDKDRGPMKDLGEVQSCYHFYNTLLDTYDHIQ